MSSAEYGIATIDDDSLSDQQAEPGQVSLTDKLGCTDTSVEAVRSRDGEPVGVPGGREHLCVLLDGPGELVTDEGVPVPAQGVACVPPDVTCELGSRDPSRWLVVSAPAEHVASDGPTIIDTTEREFVEPSTSTILTTRLTADLGCTGMKVNARLLEPGDRVPYHTEGQQEELFIPVSGDATRMLIAGESIDLPVGSIARVSPQTPRAAVNAGTTDSVWVMVGAPPTGDADEWDPGATILDWPDSSE